MLTCVDQNEITPDNKGSNPELTKKPGKRCFLSRVTCVIAKQIQFRYEGFYLLLKV